MAVFGIYVKFLGCTLQGLNERMSRYKLGMWLKHARILVATVFAIRSRVAFPLTISHTEHLNKKQQNNMPGHDSRLQRNLNDNFGKASSTKPATNYISDSS